MNYVKEYDEYWSRADRWGSSSFESPGSITEQLISLCNPKRVLDVGCGMGVLVHDLLSRKVDAFGMDIAAAPITNAERTNSGRFVLGSICNIPFVGDSFHTILCTGCMEHIEEKDIAPALAEFYRITQRFVYVVLATSPDRDNRWHVTVHEKGYWENAFFNAGFRKHPAVLSATPYEDLNMESWQITLLLEKIPSPALAKYPLSVLQTERDLHMDMLRETGRRSDAHIARYSLAGSYIKANDRVLDAACGLGYGTAIMAETEPTTYVTGIDNNNFAFDYASQNFASPHIHFRKGDICDLSHFEDKSLDLVVSFETIEHLKNPEQFLTEARRVLKNGGTFIGSVPNMWIDQTGKDPNPNHYHVFDLRAFRDLIQKFFHIQDVYRQNAGGGMKYPDAPRLLKKMSNPTSLHDEEAEWWLLAAIRV